MSPTAPTMPLGIEGFTYADLYSPARLQDLYERFCRDVAAADPAFWAEWDAYRAAPDAPRSPVEVSDLIVRMAPHVSRFVERALRGGRRRRRACARARTTSTRCSGSRWTSSASASLPLVKGGAHVHREAGDAAMVEALIAAVRGSRPRAGDRHGRLRAARSRGGAARRAAPTPTKAALAAADRRAEALVRLVPARPGLQGRGSIFRFPETLDYQHLVQVQRPRADLPEAMIGPDAQLRRRDGFALTDRALARRARSLSEIHYCVLCHERDKDSCSKGLQRQDGRDHDEPARHPARRLPARREDLRDAHAAEGRRRDRRAGHRRASTTRWCPAPATASATTA